MHCDVSVLGVALAIVSLVLDCTLPCGIRRTALFAVTGMCAAHNSCEDDTVWSYARWSTYQWCQLCAAAFMPFPVLGQLGNSDLDFTFNVSQVAAHGTLGVLKQYLVYIWLSIHD